MRLLWPVSRAALQLVALAAQVAAHRPFLDCIPNGHAFVGEWPALGHVAPLPTVYQGRGFPRNPFGLDFKAAGLVWTVELCQKDSDGDSRSNGEELGDPLCLWKIGDTPAGSTNLSHPGLPHVPLGGSAAYWTLKVFELEQANARASDAAPVGVEVDHGLLMDTSPLAPEIYYYHYLLIPLLTVVALLLLSLGVTGAHRPNILAIIVITYLIGHVGVFIGNHRCYSHRSFEPSPSGHKLSRARSLSPARSASVVAVVGWFFETRNQAGEEHPVAPQAASASCEVAAVDGINTANSREEVFRTYGAMEELD